MLIAEVIKWLRLGGFSADFGWLCWIDFQYSLRRPHANIVSATSSLPWHLIGKLDGGCPLKWGCLSSSVQFVFIFSFKGRGGGCMWQLHFRHHQHTSTPQYSLKLAPFSQTILGFQSSIFFLGLARSTCSLLAACLKLLAHVASIKQLTASINWNGFFPVFSSPYNVACDDFLDLMTGQPADELSFKLIIKYINSFFSRQAIS